MNYSRSTFVVFLLFLFVAEFAAAQAPPGLPIDGGISFLVLSGLIYGVYESCRKR